MDARDESKDRFIGSNQAGEYISTRKPVPRESLEYGEYHYVPFSELEDLEKLRAAARALVERVREYDDTAAKWVRVIGAAVKVESLLPAEPKEPS